MGAILTVLYISVRSEVREAREASKANKENKAPGGVATTAPGVQPDRGAY